MIVDSGLQHIADRMAERNQNPVSHIAVGTASTGEEALQTTLSAELTRVGLSSVTRSDKKVVYVGNFPAGSGTGALTEVGFFNASSAGDMLSRIVFPVKNKGANDTLQITIEHTYARG